MIGNIGSCQINGWLVKNSFDGNIVKSTSRIPSGVVFKPQTQLMVTGKRRIYDDALTSPEPGIT